jgi:hypothetical protein
VDGRSRLYRALDERDQAVPGEIVDALQPNTPETLGLLDLDRDRDDRLGVGLPAEHAALDPTQVCLVDLDEAGQSLAAATDHRAAVAVQHRPRRLVGAQPNRPLRHFDSLPELDRYPPLRGNRASPGRLHS